jgi:upstream activation factor subunit UAF30
VEIDCVLGSSDEDWSKSKAKSGGKKPKYTGFTRPYKLSPELASLMGAKEMPRHEVVKKVSPLTRLCFHDFQRFSLLQVWAIIKEKNLYDPKNKQYAICDKELEKVIGVKR